MNIQVDGMDFHVNLQKLKQVKEYIVGSKRVDENVMATNYVVDIINIIIDKNTKEMENALGKLGKTYNG